MRITYITLDFPWVATIKFTDELALLTMNRITLCVYFTAFLIMAYSWCVGRSLVGEHAWVWQIESIARVANLGMISGSESEPALDLQGYGHSEREELESHRYRLTGTATVIVCPCFISLGG